jgi:hypothetical protein
MLPLTAAAGALSLLTSLLQSSTAKVGSSSSSSNPQSALSQTFVGGDTDGDADQSPSPISATGAGASPPSFDPGMLAALLSLQGQQANGGASGSSGLFSNLDTNGDGQISKSEFEGTLGSVGVDTSSADALFSKLDTNGDGSVSQSELASAQHGHGHHHHHMDGASQGGGLSSLLNPTNADGSTTKTATNTDGSTTTTISYTDGTTIDMTTPAASQDSGSSGGGSGAPSQSNLIEQLIRMQSQLLEQSAPTVSTIA